MAAAAPPKLKGRSEKDHRLPLLASCGERWIECENAASPLACHARLVFIAVSAMIEEIMAPRCSICGVDTLLVCYIDPDRAMAGIGR